MPESKPVLLWDGRCGFCKIWINYWKQLVGDRIIYKTSQDAGGDYPQIDPKEFSKSVQLVRPDGSVASGAHAVFESLGMLKTYQSKIFAAITEFGYRWIAAHRDFAYTFTKYTFGRTIEPARFEATQWLFVRALAVIYAIAFASFATQVTGLIGSHGIVPLNEYLQRVTQVVGPEKIRMFPMVFWFGDWSLGTAVGDKMLVGFCWLGFAFSILLLLGRMQGLLLALLYIMYLSLSSAGQDFMSFQWDALLLEAGFLAIFLGRGRIVAWLFRWLVFRLYFLSGAVKLLSKDENWRNGNALGFHYHTQPLPTIFAWYFDKAPAWFNRFSTYTVLAVELGFAFLVFMPRKVRHFGAYFMIGLQVMILLTGNYTFFNILTIALCLFLFDDQALRRFVPQFIRKKFPNHDGSLPRRQRALLAGFAAIIALLTTSRMIETFAGGAPEPLQTLVRVASPFEIANTYGLFAVMTTTRPEIIVEGSDDGENWKPYEFRYKPGDLRRPPQWIAPFQPRLDWQMWFAALGSVRDPQNRWFISLMTRLLEGSHDVEDLLKTNPFTGKPPRYIRANVYEYTFSASGEKTWWDRKPLGVYLPPVGFKKE